MYTIIATPIEDFFQVQIKISALSINRLKNRQRIKPDVGCHFHLYTRAWRHTHVCINVYMCVCMCMYVCDPENDSDGLPMNRMYITATQFVSAQLYFRCYHQRDPVVLQLCVQCQVSKTFTSTIQHKVGNCSFQVLIDAMLSGRNYIYITTIWEHTRLIHCTTCTQQNYNPRIQFPLS